MAERLRLPHDASGLRIVKSLAQIQSPTTYPSSEKPCFDLAELFSLIGIQPQGDVYINWYRFDRIDRIAFDDLRTHFSDIWYPSSDDVDIFPRDLRWVVSIAHHGDSAFVKF